MNASPLCLAVALAAATPCVAAGLDLAALLREADAASPALLAAGARVDRAGTLPDQAGALPDPTVSFSLQNESLDTFTLGDTFMSNATVAWSQEIPYRGKRARRAAAAGAEAGVVRADADRIRLELRSRIKTAYVDLHRIHATRRLVEENRGLLVSLRDAARARFETGGAPMEAPLGAGAAIARLDADLAALDGDRSETEARLAALLGREGPVDFGPAVEAPVEIRFDPDALAAAAAEDSSRVAVLRAAAQREEARIDSLRLEEKPDFSWGAAYAYRGSLDPMVMGMFGVRLPLFRDVKQRRAVAEAEHALEAVRQDTAQAALDASSSVHEGLARAEAAAARSRVFREAVVPQARAALDAATAAYSSGRADFATLLDYARDLLADARMLEELRAQRLTSLALLEPSVGTELIVPAGATP